MKPDVLLLEPMMNAVEAELDATYQIHRLFQAADHAAFLAPLAAKVRAIVTGGGTGASVALVDQLPALEIIAINGIGTDAVDLGQARRRGIRVTTTPGVLTDDVADLGIALLLTCLRQLCIGDRFVRSGSWGRKDALPLARKASGKRVGILGMGRVGRAIARRAEAFDMPIAYNDIREFDDVPYRYVADLVELATDVDCLIVAASGGEQSRAVVNAAVMGALGPEGVLVNIARGSVVDEPALIEALTSGRLGGAGLDVFVDEPNVPEALWTLDNVVLQPHRASATIETRTAMGELVLANLAAHFAGNDLPSAVV